MKKFFLMLAIFYFFSISSNFAQNGKISGFVFDKSTHQPIPDANVFLSRLRLGAASEAGGHFFINKIPPGKYEVTAKVIGYQTQSVTNIEVGENTTINFYLSPEPIQFDPIVVSASLSEHRQSQISVSTEVLTLAKLNEQTGNTAGEVLESVAGLYIKNYDGFAGVLSPSIRGANTDQVVILLDDMRLNTAQGGGVDLNSFPTAALEKIEVVRGGHSAIVGSDALGGAIHLISKESISEHGFSYGLHTTIGSFGTKIYNFFGSHKIGALTYFVNFNASESDGNFSYKTVDNNKTYQRENNDYKGNNLFFKSKFDFNANNRIQLIYHDLSAQKGAAGSVNTNSWTGAPMLTPLARSNYDRRLLSLSSTNQLADRFRIEEQLYFQSYDFHYTDPGSWTPSDDRHQNRAMSLNLKGSFHVNSAVNLVSGMELRQDRLKSTKFIVKDRNVQSLFAQAEINQAIQLFKAPINWTWIPACRWDNYSDVEAFFSPKFGMLVTAGEQVSFSLRGNVGQSYRTPTFDDLYWPDEGWGRGNPTLSPEISTDTDLGFIVSKKTNHLLQAEMSFFENDIKNLIAWGPNEAEVWMPQNIGKAQIRGLETCIKFSICQDRFYANFFHTYMRATDETDQAANQGKRLIYRPDSKFDLIWGMKLKHLSTSINYRRVSKRFTTIDNLKSLPAYQLLNSSISYFVSVYNFNMETKFQLLNIFDESIYLNDGFPMPGREFRFSLGFNY